MPSKTKGPHHKGTFHQESARIRAAAYADPTTRCWRCGRTLEQVRKVKPHAKWTAGHLIDSTPGAPLAAECSPCNYSHGAALGNRSPLRKRAATWRPRLPDVRRTDLTWTVTPSE